ncbi:HAD domain-containing protein [Amycolatopsis sp. 195334CR]|uniref:HAD domain-containing protein n=1 Tax=Amycolatopsis sp. 195334CR TaxID=2814588 RepID=UPI001A8DC8DD|nr:HAD domain-containing protein [Amycolatopsis sp. 195334CR]MBN6034083.1 hypothetical protein [Amycolatopsis sp. 195334CR]
MTSTARASRPLIAVDVDGVLAPDLDERAVPAGYRPHRYRGPNSIGDPMEAQVYLNPEHGRWLRALADRGAELVWATTWRERAAEFIAPRVGLPADMPVIEVGAHTGIGFGHSLKHPAVTAFAANRPLAWIDDHFGGKDAGWAADRTAAGTPTLLLQIPGARGLGTAHIEILHLWISAQQPGNPLHTAGPWQPVRLPTRAGVEANLGVANDAADEVLHELLSQRLHAHAGAFELIVQYLLAADDAAYLGHRPDAAANHRSTAIARMPDQLAAVLAPEPPRPGRRDVGALLLSEASEHSADALEGPAAQAHVVALATAAQHELAQHRDSATPATGNRDTSSGH